MSSRAKEVIPHFDNVQEELDFYKKRYKEKCTELEEVEGSFNDFQQSSKELEGEMEKELEIKEKKLEEMKSQYHRLKQDHDESMEKSRRIAEESARMINNLQEEVAKTRKLEKELLHEKQKLEQDNDNFERKVRVLEASVSDLTRKHQEGIEENVVLQTEVEEYKTGNQETVQRLKDELRDLKLELSLHTSKPPTDATSKLERMSSQIALAGDSFTTNGSLSDSNSIGSIGLVDEMLSLVKDIEQKLFSNKHNLISTPSENSLHVEEMNANEQPAEF